MSRAAKSPVFWLLLAIVTLYTVFSLTGNYDVTVGLDEVSDVANAWELVHDGSMPRHGGLSGLLALNPPGISFAYVPGVLLSPGNPAAAERIGAAFLFFGTLLGLYLWLNGRLGRTSTALALAIFSVGAAGSFFAVSLWPRAHPFFYVWMLYFSTLWIERRDARFLAAALVTYAAGMYWFLEFAPAIFILPVLYVLYRPPLGWRLIAAACAASLLLSSPYLVFEAGRGFRDITHLLTQHYVSAPARVDSLFYDAKNHPVNATYAKNIRDGGGEKVTADSNLIDSDRWFETPEWGTVWFQVKERMYLGEPGYVFYSDKLGGWAFQSVTTGRILLPEHKEFEKQPHAVPFPTTRQPPALGGLWLQELRDKAMRFAPVACFSSGSSFAAFAWHLVLFAAALAFVFKQCEPARTLKKGWRKWFPKAGGAHDNSTDGAAVIWCVILIGVLVPTVILTGLSRADSLFEGERHFRWLWVAYAAALGGVAGAVRAGKWRIGAALGIVAVITLSFNTSTRSLAGDAFQGIGKTGRSEAALKALADVMEQDGRKEAYIGYDMNFFRWLIEARLYDGTSKNFEDLDLVLLMRHGIRNLDTSVEGISPRDQYVLRNTDYGYVGAKNSVAPQRWSMTLDGSLPATEVVARTGDFEILRVKNTEPRP